MLVSYHSGKYNHNNNCVNCKYHKQTSLASLINVNIYMYVYIFMYVYMCIFIYMYIYACTCMFVCV